MWLTDVIKRNGITIVNNLHFNFRDEFWVTASKSRINVFIHLCRCCLFATTKNTDWQSEVGSGWSIRSNTHFAAEVRCFLSSPVGDTNGLLTAEELESSSPFCLPPNRRFWLIGW